MIIDGLKYSLRDLQIIPAVVSDIDSRSECNVYRGNNLPLFTAPMSTVVDDTCYKVFEENKIIPIIPRHVDFSTRIKLLLKGKWVAFSLDDAEHFFFKEIDGLKMTHKFGFSVAHSGKVLIDIANGHMERLFNVVDRIKQQYPYISLMIGNVANPETYRKCCEMRVDYVRLGIGNGQACITSSNTGVHYPMGSLINECYQIKDSMTFKTCIIADGGMKNYSDIIKALALGADYVMCGGIFAKMLESAGTVMDLDRKEIDKEKFPKNKVKDTILTKEFYGMSSKKAQKLLSQDKIKTSEGKTFEVCVEYTMAQWCENFQHYLSSAMSYCGKRNLYLFCGQVNLVYITNNASNSFNE